MEIHMAYLYFIKVRVLISLAYRFEAISSIFIQFIILAVDAFFWRAVYANYDIVQDVDLNQMLTYAVMSVLLNSFFCRSVEDKLRSKIRDGSVATDYIKPINFFGMLLAEDAGGIVVNMTQRFLPLIIFSCIFITPPIPASALHFLLFLLSACVSFFILWLIAAIFGLLNFWLIDIGPIGGAKNIIIAFLSGSIVPIWFFPDNIQRILAFTPFIYIYQTPIGIYIGRTAVDEVMPIIGIQIIWVAVFFALFWLIKVKALKNIMVQGG
jgi:ABC-2 type transport system permease protein